MKSWRILTILSAAVLIMTYSFPTLAAGEADIFSAGDSAAETVAISGEQPGKPTEGSEGAETVTISGEQPGKPTEGSEGAETVAISGEQPGKPTEGSEGAETVTISGNQPEKLAEENAVLETTSVSENCFETLPTDKKPAFHASIKYYSDGYVVKGCFTEFMPDTILVRPQSSLDGENWQDCGVDWNLFLLGREDTDSLYTLQNQISLYDKMEPLKSYLAGKLDCFYLRLRITRKNGAIYETEAAVMERGESMAVPGEITLSAGFPSTMLVRETSSSGGYVYCGRYQITVSADAASEEIVVNLPDTLPIQVDLQKGKKHFADCIIDCPVNWKPISLPGLTAGGRVTLRDAAEEIVIPAGTVLSTPAGRFTLSEPLGIDSNQWMTDEVVLVLNVVPESGKPTGALAINNNELKMAFNLKPTGATSIRAYFLADGESKWTELSGLPLLDAVDAQPATANSGYTDILTRDQEPYRSYLVSKYAGEETKPFFVGLKIEGGVYDGCQLILACPDTYDIPPDLVVRGFGGNEGNAGNGSRGDSTETGQRPHLPNPQSDSVQAAEQKADVPAGLADNPPNGPDSSAIDLQAHIAGVSVDADAPLQADLDGNAQTGASKMQTDAGEGLPADQEEIPADSDRRPQADTVESRQTDSYFTLAGQSGTRFIEVPEPKGQANPGVIFLIAAAAAACVSTAIIVGKIIAGRKAARF